MSTDLKISQLTPATTVNTNDYTVMVDGNTSANKRATVAQILAIAGAGTVTSINVSGSNGINASGVPITSSGTIALSLGAITPTSIVASGTISGSNLSNTNTGDQAITMVGDVTAPASTGTLTATLANSVVTNDKLADMVGPTVKGRTSGTGIPQDLSTAQVTAMLPEMVADSGTGGSKGLVPPPTAGSAAAKKFLRADATWVATDLNDILPSQGGNSGKVLQTSGTTTSWQAVGVGSVTNVSVTNTGNGVSGTVATATTTPAISISLGAITPTSVNSVVVSGTSTPTLAVTGTSSISGSNTGDQTITLTGGVTGSGTGSFAATVITNANLTGDVTSAGNATTLTNAPVIAKVLTGYTSGAGTVAATDSILQAIQKLNGNDATNANLTGVITSVGNATSIASQTGTGSKFVVDTSPTLITPDLGTPTALVGTNITGTAAGLTAGNVTTNANLTGGVTSVGNAATVVTNANLTGVITSVGNATSIASQTGTGTTFVVSGSPTITTPVIAQINDANGNATIRLTGITSATDYLEIKNGIGVGSPLHVVADGASANIGMHVQPKGTGLLTISDGVDFNKGIRFRSVSSAASAVTLIDAVSTAGRVITLPDATDMLVGRATTDTLTNKTLTSPTITGGALNGTLGATTASTIAATTIVGSGSAIFGNTSTPSTSVGGIQINNPFSVGPSIFSQAAAVGNRWIDFMGSSTTVCSLTNNSGVFSIAASSSGAEINVAGTQRGLFSSTGLAITGTLSASSTANIGGGTAYGTGATIKPATDDYGLTLLQSNDNAVGWGLKAGTSGGLLLTRYAASAFGTPAISITAAGAVSMANGLAVTGSLSSTTGANFATSSGNVGVGTASPAFKTEIQQAVAGVAPSLRLTPQLVLKGYNGNNSFHSGIGFSMNEHTNGYWGSGILEVDDSGSYGAALAFYTSTGSASASPSERVRISSAGNVGIGTASPNYKFEVQGSPSWFRNFAGTPAAPSEAQDWPVAALNIASYGDFTSQTMLAFTLPNDGNYFTGYAAWNFKLLQTASSITSAGVSGMEFGGPGYLSFLPSGTERARISSTGLAVTGSVSASTYGYFGSAGVAPSASNPGFAFSNPLNVSAASWSAGTATTSLTLVNVYNGNGIVGSVVTNGTATAWNISSDARLKTNLRDITNSSVIIDALKPRRFDWLTFTKEKDDYGFVAQEAYEVYPKMVTVGGDDPAEKPWGMDASKLIPVLVAELQSLRKRLAALEAK